MSDTPPEIIELRNEAGDFGAANMVYIGDAEEAVHKAIARVKADAQRTFDLFTADTEACRTREIVEWVALQGHIGREMSKRIAARFDVESP